MAVTKLKDGRWICYYRKTGADGKSRIKKEYFGRGPKAEAAAWYRHNELGLSIRRHTDKHRSRLFSELARAYLQHKNFNVNSRKHLKIRLQSAILPHFGHLQGLRIDDAVMDDYVAARRQAPVYNRAGQVIRRGVKFSTISRELTDVKAILNWAAKRNPPMIEYNPVANYQKPAADDAIIPPPTAEETAAILEHASAHLIRVIHLSYYLGLRPGAVELLTLRWHNVSWDSATILIVSAHKGGPERRQVPIHPDFYRQLKDWYQEDNQNNIGHIIHYHGRPIKKIQTAWEQTLKRAGITRRIRPYDLRHYFVSKALEHGADVKALADIVGSRPETLVRHYQHVSRRLHRDTVAKIPPLKKE